MINEFVYIYLLLILINFFVLFGILIISKIIYYCKNKTSDLKIHISLNLEFIIILT